jgi:hypothetical protein
MLDEGVWRDVDEELLRSCCSTDEAGVIGSQG